jgi:HAD superfamily hydrolase (TIGR01509 family)
MNKGTPAVLFDVDGTLVDTNYLHTMAWWRALKDMGQHLAASRVHQHIGMGSDQLMEALVGRAEWPELKEAHRRRLEELKPEIVAFPKAAELLRVLAAQGVNVVLATSSDERDVDALVAAIDAGDAVAAVTSAGDVEEAKPRPDVFQAAMKKGGCDPDTTVVVGDTVWDVEAAGRAGLPCVGVLSGGICRSELERAGAVAVYDDVAALLDDLEASPIIRSRPADGDQGVSPGVEAPEQ